VFTARYGLNPQIHFSSCGFPRINSKCSVSTEIPHYTARFKLTFYVQTQPFKSDLNFVILLPSKHKIQPSCSTSVLSCVLHTSHFPTPYLASSQTSPDGRAGIDCLETFNAVDFAPAPTIKYQVSPYSIPPHSAATEGAIKGKERKILHLD
jgi:hypothetical protein